jgi:hypothetical protein
VEVHKLRRDIDKNRLRIPFDNRTNIRICQKIDNPDHKDYSQSVRDLHKWHPLYNPYFPNTADLQNKFYPNCYSNPPPHNINRLADSI